MKNKHDIEQVQSVLTDLATAKKAENIRSGVENGLIPPEEYMDWELSHLDQIARTKKEALQNLRELYSDLIAKTKNTVNRYLDRVYGDDPHDTERQTKYSREDVDQTVEAYFRLYALRYNHYSCQYNFTTYIDYEMKNALYNEYLYNAKAYLSHRGFKVVSLDDMEEADNLATEQKDPTAAEVIRTSEARSIYEILKNSDILTERQIQILNTLYFTDPCRVLSYAEAGKILHTTSQNVSQIHRMALNTIQRECAMRGLTGNEIL